MFSYYYFYYLLNAVAIQLKKQRHAAAAAAVGVVAVLTNAGHCFFWIVFSFLFFQLLIMKRNESDASVLDSHTYTHKT